MYQKGGKVVRKSLLAALLLLSLGVNVFAQTGNGSIGGNVEDPSKALIPGVTVTARNVETNVSTTQLTNESGVYNFPVLQPGNYEVTAGLSGFKEASDGWIEALSRGGAHKRGFD